MLLLLLLSLPNAASCSCVAFVAADGLLPCCCCCCWCCCCLYCWCYCCSFRGARERRPFRAPPAMDQLTCTRFFFGLVRPVLKYGPKSPTVGQIFCWRQTCKRFETACLDPSTSNRLRSSNWFAHHGTGKRLRTHCSPLASNRDDAKALALLYAMKVIHCPTCHCMRLEQHCFSAGFHLGDLPPATWQARTTNFARRNAQSPRGRCAPFFWPWREHLHAPSRNVQVATRSVSLGIPMLCRLPTGPRGTTEVPQQPSTQRPSCRPRTKMLMPTPGSCLSTHSGC